MNYNLKRFLAVFIILVIAFGWYVTIFGLGSAVKPTTEKIKLGLDIKGGVNVVLEAKTNLTGSKLKDMMNQTQSVIEKRVNQMGLSEPVVTIEGTKRIRVELPGADNAEEAIRQIGRTAQLKFTLADGSFVLDGSDIETAISQLSQEDAGYEIALQFKASGRDKFADATTKAYGGQITPRVKDQTTGQLVDARSVVIMLDNEVISAPTVTNGPITEGRCSITGNFTKEDADNQAALIRGGALPVELEEVSSSVQTATIGYDALEKSVLAGLIGLVIIFLIMFIGYRIMGLAANIALLFYVVIILQIMALMGSVLTLPGIAGIILSVGMAVDANVIIFSRIKEEILTGKSVRVAVQTGFKRALSTIIDSQVTTFIAAIILYQIGTSAVRGFAWTLMIGIIASIFTAVIVTQLYLGLMANNKFFSKLSFYGIKKDGTATFQIKKELHWIKYRKIFYIATIAIMVVGLAFGVIRGLNYGIDFTGGTMIQIDMGKQVPAKDVADSIQAYNLDPEIIYSGEGNREVVIRSIKDLTAPERQKVIETLQKDFGFTDEAIVAQELFGPSIGKELRNNAIKAIIISAICMLIYIRLRFREWKFGGSALIGVLNDVLLVIAFYAIFNVPVNNPFIAGILTVVGYSINDTIVVFDRIRENQAFSRKEDAEILIDHSITQTLGRSLMTSFTTLIVMVPLFIMTGEALREFTLPLMVGIIAGAASSIMICSPLYFEFNKMSRKSRYEKSMKGKKNTKKSKK